MLTVVINFILGLFNLKGLSKTDRKDLKLVMAMAMATVSVSGVITATAPLFLNLSVYRLAGLILAFVFAIVSMIVLVRFSVFKGIENTRFLKNQKFALKKEREELWQESGVSGEMPVWTGLWSINGYASWWFEVTSIAAGKKYRLRKLAYGDFHYVDIYVDRKPNAVALMKYRGGWASNTAAKEKDTFDYEGIFNF